jgi:hypothetical protein
MLSWRRLVDSIYDSIDKKGRRSLAEKIFFVSVDREEIMSWKQSLDRFLLTFNVSRYFQPTIAKFTCAACNLARRN